MRVLPSAYLDDRQLPQGLASFRDKGSRYELALSVQAPIAYSILLHFHLQFTRA